MTIIITCYDCLHINRQERGAPGFEMRSYVFETFSEAHQHMITYPDHYLMFEIRKDEDE